MLRCWKGHWCHCLLPVWSRTHLQPHPVRAQPHPKPAPIPFVLQHMMDMLTLTTRMNALARVTLGNVNIAATTALQVRRPCAGPKGCSCGRGAAVQRRGKAAGCAARGMGAHCN